MFVIFFISALAETNRQPFDLPEAEAELVAAINVEYSAMTFALFFLGEYANMILMSGMTVILFLGGWLPPIDIAPFNWSRVSSGSAPRSLRCCSCSCGCARRSRATAMTS